MNAIDIIFIIANFILLIGTSILIVGVIRNRNLLRGYNPVGSVLTFVPCVMFGIAYVLMNNWLSLLFASVTIVFWLLASIFSIKNMISKKVK